MADPFQPKFADLVRNYSTTVGTGDFKLGPAVNGYTSFSAACAIGDSFYYSAIGVDKPAEREVGRGTLQAGGTITRDPIGGTKTNFSSGTKSIALIAAAEWFNTVQTASSSSAYLKAASNLSDVASPSTARGNLGLGSAATLASDPDPALSANSDLAVPTQKAVKAYVDGHSAAGGALLATNDLSDVASAPTSRANLGLGSAAVEQVSRFPVTVADRTALASYSATSTAYLREFGREGLFVWSGGNLSTMVAVDTRQGVFVAPASDTTGASGAWVRKYSGAANARWFGATGDGTTDDYTALQAWLDYGGDLYLSAAKYRSSQRLIVRKCVRINGASFGFDNRIAGYANLPGSRIVFDAGVSGLDIQPQWTGTDWTSLTATQEGGYASVFNDIALIGSGGATATGFHARTLIYGKNVTVYGFSGKGFDISASVGPDGTSESGNASLSTLTACTALGNASHGFHLRGTDANVIKLDGCNASSNGGWGFLDEAEFANQYLNCHAANNTSGSYKATGGVATHTFANCYVEGDIHANCDISAPANVIGGNLAGTAAHAANNAHSGGPLPTIADGGGYSTFNAIHVNWNYWGSGAGALLSTDMGVIGGHASYGLVIQGTGATYDVALVNKNGIIAAAVPTGTQHLRLVGNVIEDSGGNGLVNTSGGIVSFGAVGGGVFNFYDSSNISINFSISNSGVVNAKGGYQVNGTTVLNSSGVLTAAAHPALTGDVTSVAGAVATTIANNAVTYAKFQQVAASSLVGNPTGALASAQAITLAADHSFSGTILQLGPFTGDITKAAGSLATAIANSAVTYAKMQNVTASRLLGNPTGSAAAPSEISLAGGLAFSGTTLTAAGALTPTSVASAGAVTSSSATAGVGYATGAGGTVTQVTSKSTGVTLSKASGQITMNAAALAAAAVVSFTVTNTAVAATDTINLNLAGGAATSNAYRYWVSKVVAGSFEITVENRSAGSLSEALVLNFAVLKAVSA